MTPANKPQYPDTIRALPLYPPCFEISAKTLPLQLQMQKLFTILLSIFVSVTYVGATLLSQSHHHHHGTICLDAVAMLSCENGAAPFKEQADNNNCAHGEEPGCAYNSAMLAAALQRDVYHSGAPNEYPGVAVEAIHITITPPQTAEKHIVARKTCRYTPPATNRTTLLRAPPEAS